MRWDYESVQKLIGREVAERALGAYAQEGRELEAAQRPDEGVYNDEPANETEEEREETRQERSKRKSEAASVATGQPAHEIGGVVVPAQASGSDAAKKIAEAFWCS